MPKGQVCHNGLGGCLVGRHMCGLARLYYSYDPHVIDSDFDHTCGAEFVATLSRCLVVAKLDNMPELFRPCTMEGA